MNQKTMIVLAAAFLAPAAALQAQSGTTPIGDFTLERVLTLAGAFAPTTPNIPPPVLAGIQSGALELHQLFVYDSSKGIAEQTTYVVPGGSPLPLPGISKAPVADHYLVQVEAVNTTSAPASVVLIGHVTSNDILTPFGNNTGSGVTLAFGYQGSGASVKFSSIVESVTPLYGLYSATGGGSLSLTPAATKCSQATLKGTYMFTLGGAVQTGNGFGPFWESGRFTADGQGNITVLDSGNIAGAVFINRTFPIAYTIDEHCQGTFNFGGASMDVNVSNDGKRMNMVFTKPAYFIANGSGQIQ